MQKYDFKKIESKWQKHWHKSKLFEVTENSRKEKFYALIEFPFLSGEGLHVGHPRPFTAMDIISRKRRMEGYNVLYPIGFDAFGLPTENFAIKTGRPPAEITKENITNFTRQLKALGFSFDWSRQINTSDPAYFKWTQFMFLKFFKAGLAYKANMPINWCPSDKIGLANEEVVNGNCERCGHPVERRDKEQWMLAITKYADKLLAGLKDVDYIERAKVQQENWIGRSEGAELDFVLNVPGQEKGKHKVTVFTTRPDTLFGATFLAVSAEVAKSWLDIGWDPGEEVKEYIEAILIEHKTSREDFEKTGIATNVTAINPVNRKQVPVWITNYVLADVGTGAIMAVPAHDQRDFEFAKKFNLPIREVVKGGDTSKEAFTGEGKGVNSEFLDGLTTAEAKEKMIDWLKKEKIGKAKVNYKLRDWVFSRQHYWGEPIPLVRCKKCNDWIPLPDDQLPLELPKVKKYQPTDSGESPLEQIDEWVNTECPQCGGPAKRETDTMPNWAGSSWYFLRYTDPRNDKEFASKEALKYWNPVDWYNGGMEHTVLHLLYSRFWNQFLYEQKLVPHMEPYAKRTSHGMILGEDGEKMSKSRGNVINPDQMLERFGADAFRCYIMFMGPFDQAVEWDTNGLVGVKRFLDRVWRLGQKVGPHKLNKPWLMHKTIAEVTVRIEEMQFNTALSALMTYVNALTNNLGKNEKGEVSQEAFEALLLLLAPFAPHLSEELWSKLGKKESLTFEKWPVHDPNELTQDRIVLAVQVNGKVRDELEVEVGISEDRAKEKALQSEKVQKWLDGKKPQKVIYVKGKLVSIVI